VAALTRNITLNLPADLIREAKIYAAQHDTSVNALVRKLLEEKVVRKTKILNADEEDLARARAAAERFLEIARRGPHFSGDPGSIQREDLYDRNWARFSRESDS
jgi:plasmid stability protein